MHRVIYDELCLGVVREESRAAYVEVVDRLVAQGAEGIILGCTEIELLIGPDDLTSRRSRPPGSTSRQPSTQRWTERGPPIGRDWPMPFETWDDVGTRCCAPSGSCGRRLPDPGRADRRPGAAARSVPAARQAGRGPLRAGAAHRGPLHRRVRRRDLARRHLGDEPSTIERLRSLGWRTPTRASASSTTSPPTSTCTSPSPPPRRWPSCSSPACAPRRRPEDLELQTSDVTPTHRVRTS